MQTASMSRPRPTIHIHSMDNAYNAALLASRKRKRSSNYYSSSEDDATHSSPISPVKSQSPLLEDDSETDHRSKRARRALNIEQGMGGMSLAGQTRPFAGGSAAPDVSHRQHLPPKPSLAYLNAHYVSEPEHLEIDEAFMPREEHLDAGEDLDEVVTPNVEEATSPIVHGAEGTAQHVYDERDAVMRTASWYEPEKDRIVITDLSDSETEQEDGDKAQTLSLSSGNEKSRQPFTVSSAYLQRFGGLRKPDFPTRKEPENSMALVAYRPVAYLPIRVQRPDDVEEPIFIEQNGSPVDFSDAMDIDD